MALDDWRRWEASLPGTLTDEERYTATLVLALERLARTFPHPWGLTGGTCLQSYLPVDERRYSSDLEIITPAMEHEVAAWMRSQALEPERVHDRALKCAITPEGTLFIIHSYPQADFEAAQIGTRPFEHFPIANHPPPGAVEANLISIPYLLATKLWEIQRLGRGGERPKDAYDLARCLRLSSMSDVMGKLEVYARHQGRHGEEREIARRAGVYLRWFAGQGHPGFVRWSTKFIAPGSPPVGPEALEAAAGLIKAELGVSLDPTPKEVCEFLIRELTPKDLAPIAKKLGAEKRLLRQYDNMREWILERALPVLAEPPPATSQDLLRALRRISIEPTEAGR